jgi:hypothetical protein
MNLEKLEENFGEQLLRLNFMFKNQNITTECVTNHPGFSLLGEPYGPFEKGKQYKLKFFTAIPFLKSNILKIIESEKCDNIDVQRYAINERDDQTLIRRENKFFLNKIKEFRHFMENKVEMNIKPKIELDRYKSYSANIVDSRLSKLLRLAKSELSIVDEQKLTNSEKKLYNYCSSMIKIWRDFFFNN